MAFGYSVYVDLVDNNSLGRCLVIRLRDAYGSLIDKQLYDDLGGRGALDDFAGSCGIGLEEVKEFGISVEAASYDPDLAREVAFLNRYGYEPTYAVEYLSMHTAIHHLLTYRDEQAANEAFEVLSRLDDDGEYDDLYGECPEVFDVAEEDFEIDYRDVSFDEDTGQFGYYGGMDDFEIIVVNAGHVVPRLFV